MVRKSSIVKIGFLLAAVLMLGSLGSSCRSEGPLVAPYSGLGQQFQQSGIWVNGQGDVMATPDIVQISLGIQAQSKTVADAQTQARTAMDGLMGVLKSKGIADKDIQTQQFRIDQVTQFNPKTNLTEVLGYRVTNTVTVKVRQIANAGAVIDGVAAAGGDLTRINSIGFTVEDPKPYEVLARDKAMADAIAKAGQLAKGAGVKLGKAVFISEGSASVPTPQVFLPMAKSADAGGAPPTSISAGELKISLNVEVHFTVE